MVHEVEVVQVVQVLQDVQVVQVVQVVRMISLDDMHSENIWFSGFKPSNYGGKLRCHACDGRTDGRTNGGGKWKIGRGSVGPETAKNKKMKLRRKHKQDQENNANFAIIFLNNH